MEPLPLGPSQPVRARGRHLVGASPSRSQGGKAAASWGTWKGTEGCGLPCTCCWTCSCLTGDWCPSVPHCPDWRPLCPLPDWGPANAHLMGMETWPGACTQDRSCPPSAPSWASALSWWPSVTTSAWSSCLPHPPSILASWVTILRASAGLADVRLGKGSGGLRAPSMLRLVHWGS